MGNLTCLVPGCGRSKSTREWRKKHYNNWLRYGDPIRLRAPRPVASRGDGQTKRCSRCGETQPLACFSPTGRKTLDGADCLRNQCKSCAAARARARYQENPEPHRAAALAWHYSDPERSKAKRRSWNLKQKYGMTIDDFDRMFEAQGQRCGACRSDRTTGINWHVDHCHVSGTVRAILCSACNTALGLLQDDVERIYRLAEYKLRFSVERGPAGDLAGA